MSLLDEIDSLKAEALIELNAATDQSSLDRAKGSWLGPQGRFTGLMKQMGSLSKEERPLAGQAINAAKAELEPALRRLIDAPGPALLDVQVPYQEHVLPMIPSGMTVRELIKK